MKKLFTLLIIAAITINGFAQSPQKMSYQCVVRNASGTLVTNQTVGIKISILQGSASGTAVYTETMTPTTNTNGLVSIEIGGGTGFDLINWSAGPYFLKTETDPAGGTNYTITGTSQLLSVPYALYAKSAANGFSGNYHDLTNKPTLFSGSYNDLTNKPVLFSGSYNELTNKPVLFDGIWISLTGKPSTLSGYGITDGMSTTHVANGITAANINNWNTAFGWGNHSGLYRPISYVPAWSEITSKPTTVSGFGITDAVTTSGDQTIVGNKTFTGTTRVETPVTATNPATKAYVDELKELIVDLQVEIGIRVKDKDGNLYHIVTIEDQVWLVENLKTTKYNDGTDIPLVTDKTDWSNLSTPGYCWYSNDSFQYKNVYGALYNWYTINSGKLCPSGWHVPTDAEWGTLILHVGGVINAGGKLKEAGTVHWISPNTGATNETGFTALPGGARNYSGNFGLILERGFWWSSTENSSTNAIYRALLYNSSNAESGNDNKKYGYSVRCIKD